MVDPDGQSYSARITDTGGTSCEIHVKGLPANTECTFTLGGVAVRDGGSFGTVKGYFETPDIADDLIDEDDDDADDETVETKPSETSRAPETLTEAVKESTHSETEYSQMETKPTEKKRRQMRSQLIKAECMRIYDSCCLNHDMSGVTRSWIRAAGILRIIRIICRKPRDGKISGALRDCKMFRTGK